MQNEITKLNQKINHLEKQNISLLSKIDRLQSFEDNYKIVNDLCNRQQDLIASQNEMIKQLQSMRRVELGIETPTHEQRTAKPTPNETAFIHNDYKVVFLDKYGTHEIAKFISKDSFSEMLKNWESGKPTERGYFIIRNRGCNYKFTAVDNYSSEMFTEDFQYLTSCVEYFLDDIEARDREPSTSPKPAPPAPPPPTIHNLNLG